MKSLPLVLLGCLSFGSASTFADQLSGIWTGPYRELKVLSPRSAEVRSTVEPASPTNKHLRSAQLVQHIPLKTIQAARGLIGLQLQFKPVLLPDGTNLKGFDEAVQGADLYRITYNSLDVTGQHTVLSGLVAVPVAGAVASGGDASGGIVVYMHGTTAQRSNAPGDREIEAYGVVTAFGGEKYVLALPDYLGYGANHQAHPYAMGKLNAMAGRDIILAARELMAAQSRSVGSDLFITGYSEGGGNSFWLARALQDSGDESLQPAAIAPMAGPYDLSGATAKSFIDPQPLSLVTENVLEKPVFLGFAAVATSQLTFKPSTALLQPAFAAQSRKLFPGAQSDDTVMARLLTTAVSNYDYLANPLIPRPETLLQKPLVDAITTHDTNFPAMKLWSENDNLDWQPKAPVYLLGVLQDPLVVFAGSSYELPDPYVAAGGLPAPFAQGNSQKVITRMRANNLGPDRVGWMGFNGLIQGKDGPETTMSHGDQFLPCSILAAKFFKVKSLAGLPVLADP